jgi:hypothetical protein
VSACYNPLVKAELDKNIEESIHRVLPPVVFNQMRFAAGWLDATVESHYSGIPKNKFSPGKLRDLGWDTMDAMLKNDQIRAHTGSFNSSDNDQRLDPEDREVVWFYIDQAREGVNRIVDEMAIPSDAKHYLRGILDATPVDIETTVDRFSQTVWDKQGRAHITLNVPDVITSALLISQSFKEEYFSQWAFRGLMFGFCAHELGHVIQTAMFTHPHKVPRIWRDNDLLHGYAFRLSADSRGERRLIKAINEIIISERFAEYFENTVMDGLGCPRTIRADYIRMMAYYMFGNGFSFRQIHHIIYGMSVRRFHGGEFPMVSDEEAIGRMIDHTGLIKKQMANSFSDFYPFDKQTVESLITKGWKSKLSQLRHGTGGNETE